MLTAETFQGLSQGPTDFPGFDLDASLQDPSAMLLQMSLDGSAISSHTIVFASFSLKKREENNAHLEKIRSSTDQRSILHH